MGRVDLHIGWTLNLVKSVMGLSGLEFESQGLWVMPPAEKNPQQNGF